MVQFRSSLSMTRVRTQGDDADDRGWNQLHVAARKGNLKEVCMMLGLSHLSRITVLLLTANSLSR
jgi:hypothetical protein